MNDTGRPSFSERDLFAPVTGIEVARCTVVDQCRLRSGLPSCETKIEVIDDGRILHLQTALQQVHSSMISMAQTLSAVSLDILTLTQYLLSHTVHCLSLVHVRMPLIRVALLAVTTLAAVVLQELYLV